MFKGLVYMLVAAKLCLYLLEGFNPFSCSNKHCKVIMGRWLMCLEL